VHGNPLVLVRDALFFAFCVLELREFKWDSAPKLVARSMHPGHQAAFETAFAKGDVQFDDFKLVNDYVTANVGESPYLTMFLFSFLMPVGVVQDAKLGLHDEPQADGTVRVRCSARFHVHVNHARDRMEKHNYYSAVFKDPALGGGEPHVWMKAGKCNTKVTDVAHQDWSAATAASPLPCRVMQWCVAQAMTLLPAGSSFAAVANWHAGGLNAESFLKKMRTRARTFTEHAPVPAFEATVAAAAAAAASASAASQPQATAAAAAQ